MRLTKRSLGSERPHELRRVKTRVNSPSRRILEWGEGTSQNHVIGSVESMFHEIATGSVIHPRVQSPLPPSESYDDLWQLGLADPRTGLPNQLLLLDRLSQALNRRGRHGGYVAVIHLNVANLDDIIEEFGYSSGDQVLSEVSRRMLSVLRTEDTVGRAVGRDLIAVLEIEDEDVMETLTQRLLAVLTDPFDISGRTTRISARLGLAVAGETEAAEKVLARADRATLSPQGE